MNNLIVLFLIFCAGGPFVLSWTGQAIHQSILSSISSLSNDITNDENNERDLSHQESAKLQQQLEALQFLISTNDDPSVVIPETSYDSALGALVNSFFHIDELMNRMLQPAEYQLNYVDNDCQTNEKKCAERYANNNKNLQKIYALRTEFHKLNNINASENDKKAFHTKMLLQLTTLLQNESSLNTKGGLRALTETKEDQGAFNRVFEFLDTIVKTYENEAISIQQLRNQTRIHCKTERNKINSKITEVYQRLEGAEQNIALLIGVFAHAAKAEVITEMNSVTAETKEHSLIRDSMKSLVESSSTSAELITLSLCQNDCSGHGACWTGVCRCDNGWQGVKCDLPTM